MVAINWNDFLYTWPTSIFRGEAAVRSYWALLSVSLSVFITKLYYCLNCIEQIYDDDDDDEIEFMSTESCSKCNNVPHPSRDSCSFAAIWRRKSSEMHDALNWSCALQDLNTSTGKHHNSSFHAISAVNDLSLNTEANCGIVALQKLVLRISASQHTMITCSTCI